jgi:predicted GNAT superfamily acetyltransferase
VIDNEVSGGWWVGSLIRLARRSVESESSIDQQECNIDGKHCERSVPVVCVGLPHEIMTVRKKQPEDGHGYSR